ncbi:electron transfer flavoprotein subunit beta/FixA family protein, partial [bacterium]|nr:electron transfer flavoprotein subunit beta/FixA family protein [bacterium]
MKIALCVKQVPDTSDIKWTENNTMQREGVESIINPYDVYATELALKVKESLKANITAFTMGPQQATNMLKELIALGVDEGVLISDKKFAGADTYATGKTIATAIKKTLPDFDLILCGQFAIDGDTAQTGPCVASLLNIPQ